MTDPTDEEEVVAKAIFEAGEKYRGFGFAYINKARAAIAAIRAMDREKTIRRAKALEARGVTVNPDVTVTIGPET